MAEHKDVLKKVRDNISTHDCPGCGGPAICAIEAGKSASTCWCMTINTPNAIKLDNDDKCLCKHCLVK